jgi:hypothetical protein
VEGVLQEVYLRDTPLYQFLLTQQTEQQVGIVFGLHQPFCSSPSSLM